MRKRSGLKLASCLILLTASMAAAGNLDRGFLLEKIAFARETDRGKIIDLQLQRMGIEDAETRKTLVDAYVAPSISDELLPAVAQLQTSEDRLTSALARELLKIDSTGQPTRYPETKKYNLFMRESAFLSLIWWYRSEELPISETPEEAVIVLERSVNGDLTEDEVESVKRRLIEALDTDYDRLGESRNSRFQELEYLLYAYINEKADLEVLRKFNADESWQVPVLRIYENGTNNRLIEAGLDYFRALQDREKAARVLYILDAHRDRQDVQGFIEEILCYDPGVYYLYQPEIVKYCTLESSLNCMAKFIESVEDSLEDSIAKLDDDSDD